MIETCIKDIVTSYTDVIKVDKGAQILLNFQTFNATGPVIINEFNIRNFLKFMGTFERGGQASRQP